MRSLRVLVSAAPVFSLRFCSQKPNTEGAENALDAENGDLRGFARSGAVVLSSAMCAQIH